MYFPDGSNADDVTVRVNAESNYNYFYQQDLVSENGVISFTVHQIPEDVTLVWFSVSKLVIISVGLLLS